MEGFNLIPKEQRHFVPKASQELLVRSFWLTLGLSLFIGIFSISILVFSSTRRGSHAPTPLAAKDTAPKIWVKKPLTRCAEQWHKRKISTETYFESQSIRIFQSQLLSDPKFVEEIPCEVCVCPSGEILYLNIDAADLEDLEGFTPTRPPEGGTLK